MSREQKKEYLSWLNDYRLRTGKDHKAKRKHTPTLLPLGTGLYRTAFAYP